MKDRDSREAPPADAQTTSSSGEDGETDDHDSKDSKSKFAIPLLKLPQQAIVEPSNYNNRRQRRRSSQKESDSNVSELKELNAALGS